MRFWNLSIIAASMCACGAAAAQPELTGKTWTGGACLVNMLFDADGHFGEFNDEGQDHYGQWEIEDGELYLVYDDMSYQHAEFKNDAFSVYYYDGPGEYHSCTFKASI